MAVTEESRYELHKHFEETMGRERATTMMELLPPVGWGDVATKQDVLLVRQELNAVKHELKQDIANLREWATNMFATKEDLHRELRAHTVALVTIMIALAGLTAALTAAMLRG